MKTFNIQFLKTGDNLLFGICNTILSEMDPVICEITYTKKEILNKIETKLKNENFSLSFIFYNNKRVLAYEKLVELINKESCL